MIELGPPVERILVQLAASLETGVLPSISEHRPRQQLTAAIELLRNLGDALERQPALTRAALAETAAAIAGAKEFVSTDVTAARSRPDEQLQPSGSLVAAREKLGDILAALDLSDERTWGVVRRSLDSCVELADSSPRNLPAR